MAGGFPIHVKLNREDYDKLQYILAAEVRGTTDQVRLWIRETYDKMTCNDCRDGAVVEPADKDLLVDNG